MQCKYLVSFSLYDIILTYFITVSLFGTPCSVYRRFKQSYSYTYAMMRLFQVESVLLSGLRHHGD